MKNLYYIVALLSVIMTAQADKNYLYPTHADFVYHLRPYVEEGNVKGIAELTTQLRTLKQSKPELGLGSCAKNYIDRVYEDIVINRDEKLLKLIAPFMVEYGYNFLKAPHGTSKRYIRRGRWEVDVASQVPGVMVEDIKKYKIYEITTFWPLIPYTAQERIRTELQTYYDDNCTRYSDDCNRLHSTLYALIDAHYVFKNTCKIMPQELKDQKAAKKAALKAKLTAYEAAEAAQQKALAPEPIIAGDDVSNSEEQTTAPNETTPTNE